MTPPPYGVGDAYPPERPADVYDADVDESTAACLAALDGIRERFAHRDRGTPSARANLNLIDTYAREIVADATEDD